MKRAEQRAATRRAALGRASDRWRGLEACPRAAALERLEPAPCAPASRCARRDAEPASAALGETRREQRLEAALEQLAPRTPRARAAARWRARAALASSWSRGVSCAAFHRATARAGSKGSDRASAPRFRGRASGEIAQPACRSPDCRLRARAPPLPLTSPTNSACVRSASAGASGCTARSTRIASRTARVEARGAPAGAADRSSATKRPALPCSPRAGGRTACASTYVRVPTVEARCALRRASCSRSRPPASSTVSDSVSEDQQPARGSVSRERASGRPFVRTTHSSVLSVARGFCSAVMRTSICARDVREREQRGAPCGTRARRRCMLPGGPVPGSRGQNRPPETAVQVERFVLRRVRERTRAVEPIWPNQARVRAARRLRPTEVARGRRRAVPMSRRRGTRRP